MSVPIHLLNQDQRNWYTNFVVAAVLADNEISVAEVEYIKYLVKITDDVEQKKNLINSIKARKTPELSSPEGIDKEILTAIFLELILIMISDLEFQSLEREFLKKTSKPLLKTHVLNSNYCYGFIWLKY